MGYQLIDMKSKKVLKKYKGDYAYFLNECWGGFYPFKLPGDDRLHFGWGKIVGCYNYNAYWEFVDDEEVNDE